MKEEHTEIFKAKAFKIGKWIESDKGTKVEWEGIMIEPNDLSGLINDYIGALHDSNDFWLNGTPFLMEEEAKSTTRK